MRLRGTLGFRLRTLIKFGTIQRRLRALRARALRAHAVRAIQATKPLPLSTSHNKSMGSIAHLAYALVQAR